MKSIITCIKHSAGEQSYFALGKDTDVFHSQVSSGIMLNLGDVVTIDPKSKEVQLLEDPDEGLAASLDKEVDRNSAKLAGRKEYRTGREETDRIIGAMWKDLGSAAGLLIRKVAYSAPIIIRFHNDTDGASGAYGVYKALRGLEKEGKANVVWQMHRGIAYTKEDAENDVLMINNYESAEKPLLFILDFGTSTESNSGVEAAKGLFDVIWLDHHPAVKGFAGRELGHYVNPWLYGGDSNFTAGFLACVFAHTFSDIDTKDIEEAAFIGDYSTYSAPTPESREIAMLLDLITSNVKIAGSSNDNLTPDMMDALMNNAEKKKEMIAYAENKVAELLDAEVSSVKSYKTETATIYVMDFGKVRGEEHEKYPLPGRFASRLLGRIEELSREPCIVVLHVGSYVLVRSSKSLEKRLGLLGIIEAMKKEHEKYVDAGGGHASAASIKLKGEEGKSAVIKALLERFKSV